MDKPKLIVFDLGYVYHWKHYRSNKIHFPDYTLWPFRLDTHYKPPFRTRSNSIIVDSCGASVTCFPEVPQVLKELSDEGYELGVASRSTEKKGAMQLLKLFNWDNYFSYKEIYPCCKVHHFNRVKAMSGIGFEEMIFFDDQPRYINCISKLGVLSILVNNGVSHRVVEEGLSKFALLRNMEDVIR